MLYRAVRYPIHPLDLSTIETFTLAGKQYTACISAFQSAEDEDFSTNGFDVALGDSFLRNVYSMYVLSLVSVSTFSLTRVLEASTSVMIL